MQRFRTIIFVTLVVFGVFCQNVYALTCAAGKHIRASGCYGCPEGCYCKGSSENSVDKGCKNTKGKFKKEGQAGVYTCPAAFPNSDRNHDAIGGIGAKSAEDCYKQSGGVKYYNQTKTCSAGQYLKANATTCSACTSGKYCPGGTFNKATADQGLKTCPAGQTPSTDKKTCVSAITCKAGQYLPANATSCASCSSLTNIKQYCAGGAFIKSSSNQGISTCSKDKETSNDARTGCIAEKRCAEGQHKLGLICYGCPEGFYCDGSAEQSVIGGKDGQAGVHKCPSTFPKSDRNQATGGVGAKTASQCYFTNSAGKKIYNKPLSCSAGKYIPAASDVCTDCLANNYCPGVTNKIPSTSSVQGMTACPSGTVSAKGAKSASDCKKQLTCNPGQYLPADATECKPCPDGKYCPDKKTYTQSSSDQGDKTCQTGYVPNAQKTGCSIQCLAGKYLPANSEKCEKCPEDGKSFCKGGSFQKSTKIQGVDTCPTGQQPKAVASACEAIKVDCKDGQYLKAGALQCTTCLDGYKCTAGKHSYNAQKDQGITKCSNGKISNQEKTKCIDAPPTSVECKGGFYLPANKNECQACTAGHACKGGTYNKGQKTDAGIIKCTGITSPNSNKTDCTVQSVTCPEKQYLPVNSKTCTPCVTEQDYVCPGGTLTPSTSVAVGLNSCGENEKPNATYTACETIPKEPEKPVCDGIYSLNDTGTRCVILPVTCSAGYALPKGSTGCVPCADLFNLAADKSVYYCPGGSITPSDTKNAGIQNCPAGQQSNTNYTACEPIPAEPVVEENIEEETKEEPNTQQIEITEENIEEETKEEPDTPKIKITKEMLKYGLQGSGAELKDQCWYIVKPLEYKNCVMRAVSTDNISTSRYTFKPTAVYIPEDLLSGARKSAVLDNKF